MKPFQTLITDYLDAIARKHQTGNNTEHSFRPAFERLLSAAFPQFQITNEPKRGKFGAPDFVITNSDRIPLCYLETKDLGADLSHKSHQEQFERYKQALSHLVITNYLDVEFYQDAQLLKRLSLGRFQGNKIQPNEADFAPFEDYLKSLVQPSARAISSPEQLAELMSGKARILALEIAQALTLDKADQTSQKPALDLFSSAEQAQHSANNQMLQEHLEAFQNELIKDITPQAFADMYAQTIVYGFFAARLHTDAPHQFNRFVAAQLIPQSNPFLRKLFQLIAGYELDSRIKWVVDALADIFRSADVPELMKQHGKGTHQTDPVIHFYETFLSFYDPKLRKNRGVWYTPEPVVQFMVRGLDDILKTEFGLLDGLADNSQISIEVENEKHQIETKAVHRVQILDPATGTGTFLAQIVRHIYDEQFQGQAGSWSGYVNEHLIPRLYGFELLMASYAMAHLQLDHLLKGANKTNQRLGIYLTNALQEYSPRTANLPFAKWLSDESNAANRIKRDTPVMCVIGNPPYSGESQNKGKHFAWITDLMDDYKKEPGSKEKLKERNPKWINDDYVKFMRMGQYFIEKNGSGVLAFINPHGFLDNPTFRGMRWHLLKTFDTIYTLDLHGNAKKKETAPDGSKDDNVFDIEQGVSINFLIKTGKKPEGALAQVFHADLFGSRASKYEFLYQHSLHNTPYQLIIPKAPMYYFVPKDFELEGEYNQGFALNEMFGVSGVGLTTAHDKFVIDTTKETLLKKFTDFQKTERNADLLHQKFQVKHKNGWDILDGYDNIKNQRDLSVFVESIAYRPFDHRFVFYADQLVWRTVRKVMRHFLAGENVGLSLCKQFKAGSNYQHIFISKNLIESSFVSNRTSEITSLFPLYLYPENSTDGNLERIANLNVELIKTFADAIALRFTAEKEADKTTFAPIDVLDYIYAVLHSPSYRQRYAAFLKVDFPRVPYPNDTDEFWRLVALGGQLRALHLMESDALRRPITQYPVDGTHTVEKNEFKLQTSTDDHRLGRVHINDTQYFDGVPQAAWDFYIGGYQPAQKWLKDRKGASLSSDDLRHYQRIISVLWLTHQLMQTIDQTS